MDAGYPAPADRPVLLLDVDGVLNPYAAPVCPPGYADHHIFPGEAPVRLCAGHGAWIRELARAFEVVWATGWGGQANTHLAPLLAVPRLPFVPFPRIPFPPELKVPAIAEYVGDRPAVWVDDQPTPDAGAWVSASARSRRLLVVDPSTGWTRETVDQAVAWAYTHGIRESGTS